MGIDGIRKPGPPVAPTGAGPSTPATHVEQAPFAGRIAETRPASPSAGPQSALEQLRAGAIDLDRYLDIKVDEATASIAPTQIDSVRSALRERLASDPTLVDLVRKATGAVEIPAPSLEE